MDLREAWKELEINKLSKPVRGAIYLSKTSKHPVQKLKNAYKQSTAFSLVFLLGFITLFFLFEEPLVKGSLVFVIFSYIFFLLINLSMYRKIKVELPVDQSLIHVLKHTHDFITSNIRFQERVALVIYPVAGTSGFFMGGALGSGNLQNMLKERAVIILLIVTLIVMTILCFYLTRWMYKKSYGKCLIELKQLITEMERVE